MQLTCGFMIVKLQDNLVKPLGDLINLGRKVEGGCESLEVDEAELSDENELTLDKWDQWFLSSDNSDDEVTSDN